ncbi:uncharacterized protein [Haliotis asinina]|uniref:uncharacterized protein n=1 Tax=Haliotis asinina TaxID=109174 RepID=UPI003531D161
MDIAEAAFLIEVQDRPVSTKPTKPYVVGGSSSIVYRLTCIPNTDGDPVSVSIVPPVSVKATASQLVLPNLKIGVFKVSSPLTSTPLTALTLGREEKLVIYNDRRGGKMPYMLIPSRCDAYPDIVQKTKPTLTLLDDNIKSNTCKYEDKLLSKFTVENTTNCDMAYATLYPFTFEGYPDTPVVVECTVYICPKDDIVDGVRIGYCEKQNTGTNRCSQVSPTSGYSKRRRRRDVGVGDSGVGRTTLRATFSVQEPLMASASRCSAGIWGLVALVYITM